MFNIDESDLGVDYQDAGPWRSYGLESHGETIEELFENAYVYEIDQDGGELNHYHIEDASTEVYKAARDRMIHLIQTTVDDILLESNDG